MTHFVLWHEWGSSSESIEVRRPKIRVSSTHKSAVPWVIMHESSFPIPPRDPHTVGEPCSAGPSFHRTSVTEPRIMTSNPRRFDVCCLTGAWSPRPGYADSPFWVSFLKSFHVFAQTAFLLDCLATGMARIPRMTHNDENNVTLNNAIIRIFGLAFLGFLFTKSFHVFPQTAFSRDCLATGTARVLHMTHNDKNNTFLDDANIYFKWIKVFKSVTLMFNPRMKQKINNILITC